MKVEGEEAHKYTAVRLDSCESVEGKGTLVMADKTTGKVRWTDASGTACAKTFGPHAIDIQPRSIYRR